MLQEELLQLTAVKPSSFTAKEVHSAFCSTVQSPVHRETVEHAAFSTQPGQYALFQEKYPSTLFF